MRRIIVVGAGQAGLLLAIGLQQRGCQVTVVAERDAETLRAGRVISNQCVFDPALRHERELGVNFWDGVAPVIDGVQFSAAGEPGAEEPAISWRMKLDHDAQSVDQRLKMSTWLTEFGKLGGEIRYGRATAVELEEYAREFELVLVAAGRGPQFDGLFTRNDALSPYREPQRAISVTYLVSAGADPLPTFPGVNFSLGPQGESFGLPVLSLRGPIYGVGFFGIPGGPLDCWDEVTDVDQQFEVARELTRKYFPWNAEFFEKAEPSGPLDFLHGRIQPIVRNAVGTLESGAHVLAMGDTAVTNDPVGGQGANMAAHSAKVYQQAILEHGDKPFDEEFLHRTFETFWARAQHATRFNNDLLAPPPEHIIATLDAAQRLPEVAHRFGQLFENPTDYEGWLTDEAASLAYLDAAAGRAG